jgi:hypothetical protein
MNSILCISFEFKCSSLQSIGIPSTVQSLCSSCFSDCELFSSIFPKSNSRLTRIASFAFSYSSLQSIVIPSTVQIHCSNCFSYFESLSPILPQSNSRLTRIESSAFSTLSFWKSLSSISFDYPSQLKRIESKAFDGVNCLVVILSTILFVAFDAIPHPFLISIDDCNSCPGFDSW